MSSSRKKRRRNRWRPWVRAIHRDAGYFVVGFTLIYAISGLAVNHIDAWDPNFVNERIEHELGAIPVERDLAAATVLERLEIEEEPQSIYVAGDELEIQMDDRHQIRTDLASGRTIETIREPRFFIRLANWLHLNRGKKAWTLIADLYAVILLYLAISGLFMVKGRKGVLGRGWVYVVVGASVPALFVVMSGGP